MSYSLENGRLAIRVSEHGAEMRSMRDSEGREYLWCGDPIFWGRTSPVLFPFVGSVKNKVYKHEGKEYQMGQHGFARDMDFELEKKDEDSLWFLLTSNEETLKKYPFPFELRIGYELNDNEVKVIWKVKNTGDRTMHFSIGAHPAFMCPLGAEKTKAGYGLDFGTGKNVMYNRIQEDGLELREEHELKTDSGKVVFTEDFFDDGVYIVEGSQSSRASLIDRQGRNYITLEFDTPLWGAWSPEGKNAPFVCIEPWYGRCDKADFEGELKDREHGNQLEAGKEFEVSYIIRADLA